MQKPTIEMVKMEDYSYNTTVVTDTEGVVHHYWSNDFGRNAYQKELAKWEADQNPQILFESETVKVMKFKNVEQLRKWHLRQDGDAYLGDATCYDFNLCILCIKDIQGDWWVIDNFTEQMATDMISAGQLIKKGD